MSFFAYDIECFLYPTIFYMLGGDELQKLAVDYSLIFKALSDETRLKIFQMLSDNQLCACKILEEFHISQPTLSYHMKILTKSGLVIGIKDGSWMKYSLNKDTIEAVKNLFERLG